VIATTVAEGKQVGAKGIELELLLNQNREAPHLLPEVNNVSTQMNTDLIARPDHE
jgi:hypothetical protein